MARDFLKQPFARDSPWNLPIGSGARYTFAAIQRAWGMAMFVDTDVLMLDKNAPLTNIYKNYDDWGAGSRCAVTGPLLYTLPIPSGFRYWGNHQGSPDGDTPNASAALIKPDGRTLVQTQPFAWCSGYASPTSNYDYTFADSSDIFGQGIQGSHGGSGLSAIGGTIRLGEWVHNGVIRHAIKLNMDSVNFWSSTSSDGFRWPATKSDGYMYNSAAAPACRQGSLLALLPAFNVAGLRTEEGKILAQCFQDYGGYICDSAGWSVYGVLVERSVNGSVRDEFQAQFGHALDVGAGAGTSYALDLHDIFTQLYVVDNWDYATWKLVSASNGLLGAGGGTARVPWVDSIVAPPPPPPPPSVDLTAVLARLTALESRVTAIESSPVKSHTHPFAGTTG